MVDPDAPVTPESLAPALDQIVGYALKYGADAADAIGTHGRALSVSVRDGALEDVDNSEGKDIGLRVMVGQRQACVSSSDFSNMSLDMLAQRAVAMARLAPEDPYCGLADPSVLVDTQAALADSKLELFDPSVRTPEELLIEAQTLEAATLAVKGVAQAEGASASWSTSAVYFKTSHGFEGGWRSSRHDLAGMAIATNGTDMERSVDYHGMRWKSDVRSAEDIGRHAGERVVARLGATQMKSGKVPVLFDRRVASSFISALLNAISGMAIARGTSFLKTAVDTQVFAKNINIIDDPSRVRGHGSRLWDGEGLAVAKRHIIKDGVLTGWLLNLASARQLGLKPSGHAQRGISAPPGIGASNTWLEPGAKSPQQFISDMGEGLLITEMFGPSLNPNTGDWSVGVAGFAIEGGGVAYPVSEVTVAGNLREIFRSMVPSTDLEFDGSTVSPSVFVEGLTIAGT